MCHSGIHLCVVIKDSLIINFKEIEKGKERTNIKIKNKPSININNEHLTNTKAVKQSTHTTLINKQNIFVKKRKKLL